MLTTEVFGTCHGNNFNKCYNLGLSKYPYLRDTRRSIGLDNFIISIHDITGKFELDSKVTGTAFYDRVALGAYNPDIHPILNCTYPDYMHIEYPPLPYFIPYRALTN